MRKKNTTLRAFQLYSSFNPKYFPVNFAKIVFDNISPYFNLWMSAEIVTALYESKPQRELFILVIITLLGNLLVRVIAATLRRAEVTEREKLNNNEAAAFNHKTLSLDYDKLEDPEIRLLRRRIKENSWINSYGVNSMRYSLTDLATNLINILFSAVLFVEMLTKIVVAPFQAISIVLLIAMIACIFLNIRLQAWANKKLADCWDETGELMLQENLMADGYAVSDMDNRIYRQQDLLTEIDAKNNQMHFETFSRVRQKNFTLNLPCRIFSILSEVCAYLIVCFYCSLGAFPVGSVIKYVGYLARLTSSIGQFFYTLNEMQTNERYLATYLEFFDIKNDMYQGSLAVEKRSDKKFDIEFKNVSFKYTGSDAYAIKNINLNLKVGERLAVVGMNGSGKTTFIKLLCRLYDPTEGEILMNDFNIRKYDYRQYLDIFSVVFQDYNLLAVPLGNNVSSAATWDNTKAERLLEEVGFGPRYAEMPGKLETPLYKNFDQDGVNVSGGEAQKIALARALYKDAPFIILDEPTAALDPIAEAEIYSKFDEIVGDKTAIYISHRLSSCRFCDKIAVFDKGEIVQIGTHEELLKDTSGKYHELWYAQASYYNEERRA